MAIDFEALLTNEQKANLLQQRIAQFAAEAYQHELNKKTGTSIGSEEQVESSTNALAVLEQAIQIHQDELSNLTITPATEE